MTVTPRAAPRATYRIQLTAQFGFRDLERQVPYLAELGISHLYLSPVFTSRPGSQHGYDITDHGQLNPELGTRADFDALVAACRVRHMGLLLDIVPNHMAVNTHRNLRWLDVLENGPASPQAAWFDIDWRPSRASMRNRLLVPILGDTLGQTLDAGGLSLQFDAAAGTFGIAYAGQLLPLDPRSYGRILAMQAGPAVFMDAAVEGRYTDILRQFEDLPPACAADENTMRRRQDGKKSAHEALARLCGDHPSVAEHLRQRIDAVNRDSNGDRTAFLAKLLDAQPYRLAWWRVAGEEINYRRFFDVNELAALRMEDPAVFAPAHALVASLWNEGAIDGVRVDHADGLLDPAQYLRRLAALLAPREGVQRAYTVVEKILEPGEALPDEWAVEGTTGYEFGAIVTGWLMHPAGSQRLERMHRRFVGAGPSYDQIVHDSKRRVMQTSLAAEISMLATRLDRLAQSHPATADFTLFDLRQAIVEMIACFPVYRTYVAGPALAARDAAIIRRAAGAAMGQRQASREAVQFLRDVLLGEAGGDPARQAAALEFTLRFQQVTGPVMAKGVEDTSFYRYSALLPMNEVGGDPTCRGISTEQFHQHNAAIAENFPLSMLATATHDSKRGEDVRFRLCALGELGGLWQQCLGRWRRLKHRSQPGRGPSRELEYLLLQTTLGIWPCTDAMAGTQLASRLEAYALKAAREAKQETSWLEPDEDYEQMLGKFVAQLVPAAGQGGFARYFAPLLEPACYFGMLNTLSAMVLKFTVPGVPDIYQGNEGPRFALVDPDNRGRVDFEGNARWLHDLQRRRHHRPLAELAGELLARWRDGALKNFVTVQLLDLRRAHRELFAAGAYLPLPTAGTQAAHVMAHARLMGKDAVIALATRWAATLMNSQLAAPLGEPVWRDTVVELPQEVPCGEYVDVLTDTRIIVAEAGARRQLRVADGLRVLPAMVLVRRPAAHGGDL